ncbi:MAG: hypothetical protein QOJ15_6041, partial [Bradyrhizobium sp.]|nr:hypothetical protein [Bradyrhizobium sp.]
MRRRNPINLLRIESVVDSLLSNGAEIMRPNLLWLDDHQWQQIEP